LRLKHRERRQKAVQAPLELPLAHDGHRVFVLAHSLICIYIYVCVCIKAKRKKEREALSFLKRVLSHENL